MNYNVKERSTRPSGGSQTLTGSYQGGEAGGHDIETGVEDEA